MRRENLKDFHSKTESGKRERKCKYLATNIPTYVITLLGIVIAFRHGE